ncbi:heat-stable 19 kDa antigen precursor, putative [Talaromyces stipitatus ATCC 10500]|uniref:Heat-stable 19 kDa antigen, putative n=1 Tax=Talaromyces stipitatus (strain ATCC 10500 / CBS 375.48 / QM 6759 / NRRL 1006) TaxID=441959 RepID=B8LWV9_TALSN|nr:heat-stable 19 kDa antigen precursor, putative [Talaromyces stipitatus ATCC 10500]EED24592.1 heat-stable 19 kDa antigen precursor, putative [Talaromyces stipitatus ATCC 10500]
MKKFAVVVAALLAFTANAAPVDTPESVASTTPAQSTPTAAPLAATQVTVLYDTTYDNSSFPISSVACSDGPNGLEGKGYNTLGQVPNFPYVGAALTITGWGSPNCGACYNITYNGVSLYVMGVDASTNGFVVSQATLDRLTGGQAVSLGHISSLRYLMNLNGCPHRGKGSRKLFEAGHV